jgi:arylsulfatase A-like enzyme
MADGRIDAAAVRALYDAEVRYADAQIGRLLDALRTSGQLENTVVILTADHGESLGEHRYYFEHGRNAYEPCAAVPLIVRAPGGARGQRGSGDLSLCDLAPSLLAWLDLPALGPAPTERETRGQALPELFRSGTLPQRPVFTEKIERASEERVVQHKAVRMGPWKRVRRYATVDGAVRVVGEELYELSSDPYESRNLMAEPPPLAPLARLDAELLRFSTSDVHFADLAEKLAKERARLEREDPATLRVLKALGY